MKYPATFIDTSAFIAFSLHTDSLHDAALAVMEALLREQCPLVTSDLVFVEFLNASTSVSRRTTAAATVRRFLASRWIEVVEFDRESFRTALDYYESRTDKSWSLVDCSSMLICKGRSISRVLTHDRHFRQAGFEILL